MLNNDKNANAKKKKKNTINTKKDENKNIMGDVDDKLFKKYSDGKNFNSFMNKSDRATNEEDKEKVCISM